MNNKTVDIYIETCREGIELPQYAKQGDAGMDIKAVEDVLINPNETKIIPTGIKVAIPEGYEIQVRARSGLSCNTPLRVSNGIGTVDAGFRNEIGVIITNTSIVENPFNIPFSMFAETTPYTLEEKGNKQGSYLIKKGDRIAQIVLNEVPKINWIRTDNVKEIGTDRQGGFGSTGK